MFLGAAGARSHFLYYNGRDRLAGENDGYAQWLAVVKRRASLKLVRDSAVVQMPGVLSNDGRSLLGWANIENDVGFPS